jgi:flagellar biosynthesis GTPase FlhF
MKMKNFEFSKYCTPAQLYLILGAIGIIAGFLKNYGTETLLTQALFLVIWAWVLNWLCSKGFKAISWIIVLLPFVFFLFMYFLIKDVVVVKEGLIDCSSASTLAKFGYNTGACFAAANSEKAQIAAAAAAAKRAAEEAAKRDAAAKAKADAAAKAKADAAAAETKRKADEAAALEQKRLADEAAALEKNRLAALEEQRRADAALAAAKAKAEAAAKACRDCRGKQLCLIKNKCK